MKLQRQSYIRRSEVSSEIKLFNMPPKNDGKKRQILAERYVSMEIG
jgi:hypothetical protein